MIFLIQTDNYHFLNASFTHATMMSAHRLDAQTPRTPVDYLSRVLGNFFNVLRCGVSERHSARVCQHRRGMRGQRQKSQQIKHDCVQETADRERRGQNHNKHKNKLCIKHKKPGHAHTNNATRVFNTPCASAYNRPRTP